MKRLIAAFAAALTAAALMTSAGAEELVGNLNRAPRSFLEEQPYFTQCQLGSVAADSVRQAGETQLALVNMGDIENDLNDGEVTLAEIDRVYGENRALAVAEITPAELWALLEHSVSHATVDPYTESLQEEESAFDGFCQIAGFDYEYDISAPAGERVMKVALEDGTALNREDTTTLLTLTATEYMLSGGYGYDTLACQPLNLGLEDALADYVAGHSELPVGETGRITMIGARQNTIAGVIPKGVLPVGSVVLIVLAVSIGMKQKRRAEEGDNTDVLLHSR